MKLNATRHRPRMRQVACERQVSPGRAKRDLEFPRIWERQRWPYGPLPWHYLADMEFPTLLRASRCAIRLLPGILV